MRWAGARSSERLESNRIKVGGQNKARDYNRHSLTRMVMLVVGHLGQTVILILTADSSVNRAS